MLIKLDQKYTESLSKELGKLSAEDKLFFSPHKFDTKSVRNLHKEKGNHYYLYFDDSGAFVGYGMLRTFGKYEVPTLGCVIWRGYRQRGEGRKLVKELINKARELKYQKIRLKVHRNNKTAFQLYQKTGFRPMDKSEDELIWMEVMM